MSSKIIKHIRNAMRSKVRVAAVAAGVALVVLPVGASAAPRLHEASKAPKSDGTVSRAAAQAMRQGYLVQDQAAYERAKRSAAARAPAGREAPSEGPFAPITRHNFEGIFDPFVAPSDSTSAVGTTRFIELINRKYALYTKSSKAPFNQGTLNQLAGFASGNAFHPQIMWDGQTNRFYYAMDIVLSSSDHRLAIGFSKTASPNNGTIDWCHYNLGYGSSFPDYPKLGDSSQFWLIGSNVFNSAGSFVTSEVIGISKPAAGTTCPAGTTFKIGRKTDLRDPSGNVAFTPVPSNQVDPSTTGYVVARTRNLPSTRLSLHRVTASSTGLPVVQSPGSPVNVPSYTVPPSARQRSGFVANSTKLLDTLDARPTQAVAAIDPVRGSSAVGIWVQHTVAGGVGSEVRWYEIRPSPVGLYQVGRATSSSYYVFNGAISPDRVWRTGVAPAFGQGMVLGFTTSGTTSFPAIRYVSKVGTAAPSGHVLVVSSPGNYGGFDCAGSDNDCRWGGYAGASPDPIPVSPATAGRGQVWQTNQYASGGTSTGQANWRTRNWAAQP